MLQAHLNRTKAEVCWNRRASRGRGNCRCIETEACRCLRGSNCSFVLWEPVLQERAAALRACHRGCGGLGDGVVGTPFRLVSLLVVLSTHPSSAGWLRTEAEQRCSTIGWVGVEAERCRVASGHWYGRKGAPGGGCGDGAPPPLVSLTLLWYLVPTPTSVLP